MAREDIQTNLRIPLDLKKRLESAAGENHRSMTAEVIARLEQSLETQDLKSALGQLVATIDQKAREMGIEVDVKLGVARPAPGGD